MHFWNRDSAHAIGQYGTPATCERCRTVHIPTDSNWLMLMDFEKSRITRTQAEKEEHR